MKLIATLLLVLLICTLLAVAAIKRDEQAYKTGYMDGYRTQQIENLPAPGLERVKRPDPRLATKTGRG